MSKTIQEEKQAIRQAMKIKRAEIAVEMERRFEGANDKRSPVEPLYSLLNGLVNYWDDMVNHGECVAAFCPFGSEPNVMYGIEEMAGKTHCRFALPRIKEDGTLSFHLYRDDDALIQNPRFKVFEPIESAIEVRPDVVFAPALVFDSEGERIGLGEGCYDRTIARLREDGKPLRFIGVSYEDLRIDDEEGKGIPSEEHDQRMDMLITEQEIYSFSGLWQKKTGLLEGSPIIRS